MSRVSSTLQSLLQIRYGSFCIPFISIFSAICCRFFVGYHGRPESVVETLHTATGIESTVKRAPKSSR
ncbi:hypothetical protein L218DRAFT_731635 [Marasmius fiardii PR-910]|nr:hypothetical protein L218DRAFT_731635 [Marasmius fiardii PR-910]